MEVIITIKCYITNVNLTCDNAFNHHVKGNYSLQIDELKSSRNIPRKTYINQTTKIT